VLIERVDPATDIIIFNRELVYLLPYLPETLVLVVHPLEVTEDSLLARSQQSTGPAMQPVAHNQAKAHQERDF
jgi:hypothetical protein